jgi:hypothetical protein
MDLGPIAVLINHPEIRERRKGSYQRNHMALKIGKYLLATALLCTTGVSIAQAPQPSLQERIAGLKSTFAVSQANLRHYQWIETTTVSVNGEQKSQKQQRCYYGADGTLEKVLVDATPPPATKPGLRGRIIANKTAEMTEYMQSAVTLVKSYVPPDPAKIQAARDAGNVSLQVLNPGQLAQVNFKSYEKPGDNLAIQINLVNSVVSGLGVSTYLDSPSDVVTLNAVMSQLDDGTIYTSNITLNAAAKNLMVTVQNAGYQKMN